MYINQNIKTIRLSKDLTQEEFAEQIGITQKLVQSYEKGRSTPTLATAEKISTIFQVTMDDLVKKELKILVV